MESKVDPGLICIENTQNILYQSIIQYMISMGTRPLNETVNLIMEIILDQIQILLNCVNDIATLRNEQKIDLEDFIFFFRKDLVRLKRLYNFVTLTKSVNDIDKQTKIDSDNILNLDKSTEKIDPIVKKFRNFLSQIDSKNGADYDKILNNDFIDHEKHQQLFRLDKQFENVPTEAYVELINLRRKAYKNISQCKYKNLNSLVWNKNKHKIMTLIANECVGFLYREILSELIESVLLLKKEKSHRRHNLELTLQTYHHNKDTKTFYKSNINSIDSIDNEYIFQPITPAEITEICRRCLLNKETTVIKRFQKSCAMNNDKNSLLFF